MNKIDKAQWAAKLRSIEASAHKEVRRLYVQAIKEITELIAAAPKGAAQNFTIQSLPKATRDKVDTLVRKLAQNIEITIIRGTGVADALLQERFEDIQKSMYIAGNGAQVLTAAESAAWLRTESTAAATEAFVKRKVGGLGLSERVWQRTELLKGNIEIALHRGIEAGTSAAELSRQVREALNQPKSLFRRVRQPDGTLALSTAAKNYHPGQGVYRSSYKNAIRMTGTEINKAYREAFSQRIQSKQWITGKRIKLSNNHTCKDGKGGLIRGWSDECDALAGLYPKDFVWHGWHPQCRCEQVIEHIDPEQAILDFKNGTNSAVQITEPHDGYQKWIDGQRAKAKEIGSEAFDKRMKRDSFLSENGKYRK